MKIEIKNVTKKIGKKIVLNNINMEFESGTIYGLKGVNGSGKTMLMRCICGLLLPTEGTVTIDGKVLGKDISFPESVGALIENPAFLSNETGFENLNALASIKGEVGKERIDEVLTIVGLKDARNLKYRKYSLGMKQRLGIGAAILEKPEILILDEPLNALDDKGIEAVHTILEQAKKDNQLVIIACHDYLELVSLTDVIYHLENGYFKGSEKSDKSILEKMGGIKNE
ncbi:ATP-binding cassette domain-containing protein [Paludicola sp. MB14-C6]|uniref:ATP-binding cassette domain-containing protein n=1 Tax=Paludihabitans sp. MB14-C6 TaxID=3070656 RepID=UPI0027DC92FD|nr:ATP-binding cassette domain-containing protein [Paludicola sp. MB14-C6]WMJ22205.1 ATP-binding cassette domain-containing protein [Paludicola sp. MB14-C6]